MKGGSEDHPNVDSQEEVVERVKARLQEEGREARNLVAYSLPLQDPPQPDAAIRHREVKRVVEMTPRRGSKQDKRPRSASAGRDPQASLRARHWGFLFRNLQQAVDEIYQTCEDDESIVECKEAILMLERYTSDFQKLIEWLKLKWEYEHTPPPQRPNSLTWEIRTSSPGKAMQSDRKILTLNDARRALTFDLKPERIGLMNGNAAALEKMVDKLNSAKLAHEGRGNEARMLSGKKTPPKPVIIVHEASIEEHQEENSAVSKVSNSDIVEVATYCEVEKEYDKSRGSGGEGKLKEMKYTKAEMDRKEDIFNGNVIDEEISEAMEDSARSGEVVINGIGDKDETTECNSDINVPRDSQNDISSTGTSEAAEKGEAASTKDVKEGSAKFTDSPKVKEAKLSRNNSSSLNPKGKECAATQRVQEATQKTSEVKGSDAKASEGGEVRRSCAEVVQGRNLSSKPGPTVNMNKASQVRQAYNQNKTPQKQPRAISANNRQSCLSRSADMKAAVTKQQGPGGKLTFRRVSEGKTISSPPLARRIGVEAGRTAASGVRPASASNTFYRSHSSLGMTNGLGNQERAASNSSLSSSTSSSGQSWADKVRGAPLSLQSSQLSLQDFVSTTDDGEGWEVVRRGRRSHGGSTISLSSSSSNNHHTNGASSSRDKRSGSLKSDGHHGSGIKNRFHMPSSAMSMPSLAVNETKEEKDSQESKGEVAPAKSGSASGQKDQKASTGKKSKSQGSLVPAEGEEVGASKTSDKKKNLALELTGQSSSRKSLSRRNRGSTKSAEELTKRNGSQKEGRAESARALSANKENKKPHDVSRGDSNGSPTVSEIRILENGALEGEEPAEAESRPFSMADRRSEEPAEPVSHLCDPSIPETSETSDADDDERRDVTESVRNAADKLGRGGGEHATSDQDLLQAEQESRNYDSDSIMDEEEMRCNAAALETAVQEEQRLKQQIEETEKAEIQVEDVEECEEDGSEASEATEGGATSPVTPTIDTILSSLSWADQVDAMESLEELRHPGRVLHIHEKLSSPSRKRSLSEKMRRHEEKLAKAQELREKLIQAKTDKLKDLFKKIEEVRQDKELLLGEKRDLFQRKMKRAEEKRRQHLQEIINKAHDEENKAKEIAFINGLEAQNKLHDIMQQHQSHESRLADMAEERTRRQEEKAAKEMAAQERRKALEAERQARMAELCEKRRRRCERIDRRQAERREELLEQAREKARDREERLSALQQAQQAKETELVKKIQQKQEESARRHEENIEQIRQRALESSIMKYSRGCDDAPKLIRYETKKLCTLCNSLITSEVYLLSHLRGRHHQEALRALHQGGDISNEDSETYNLKHIIDAPANIDDPQVTRDKERQKALKRRCKKIRTRMTTRGKDYETTFKPATLKDSPNKSRMMKALQQIVKLVANQGSGPWLTAELTALDRPLLELLRILEKREKLDQAMFSAQNGFVKLNSVLRVILDATEQRPCVLPAKSLGFCGRVLLGACRNNPDSCRYILYSNLAGTLIDYLMQRLNELVIETTRVGSNGSINTIVNLPSDAAIGAMFEVLAEMAQVLCDSDLKSGLSSQEQSLKDQAETTWLRIQDVVSYCVSVGLADKISWYFSHVQGPLDNDAGVVEIILAAMRLISALAKCLSLRSLPDDPTQLIGTLHVTDACGVVSLLYGLLLHQGGRSSMVQAPVKLSKMTESLTIEATTLLHQLASLDLNMFQAILGSEGISLELRHIASYLLWYCSHWPCDDILHNVIPLVGFFAVNNKENQMVIQSGEMPSVLQQLCNLPWQYFSEPRLTAVLFPTLLACSLGNHDNMLILQQEMSFQVLEDFLHNSQALDKPLVHILRRTYVQG
ncbi:S phase cyclin A-associated protein in the endoplasmic reticulum-like isoform X3 [Penaeus japonicus]|uniref:S phase cyclin A-associated protein in the endoplasmic reticulum-like isoform X3 n=1 Tax=Penaeus japonicus TaxID=27405 RepID=UPI001C71294A|nr:S phase cyclin A-associated protein in the endoplasmic reticulum-like isoform X3 [Penaeus japonicus]